MQLSNRMLTLPWIFSSQRSANLHSSLPRKRLHPQCCNKLYVAIYSAAVSCISFHVGFKHILYFALNANATKNTEEDTRVLCPFLHSVVFQCVFVCLCVFCVFLCFFRVFFSTLHFTSLSAFHCTIVQWAQDSAMHSNPLFFITIHIVFALQFTLFLHYIPMQHLTREKGEQARRGARGLRGGTNSYQGGVGAFCIRSHHC